MINKSQEIETLIDSKLELHPNLFSPNELRHFMMNQFFVRRLIIDVKGRNGRFDDCQKMIEKQSKLLAKLNNSGFEMYPVAAAMHLEQSILADLATRAKLENINSLTSTPEVILKFERMKLNPSGNFLSKS